MAGELLANIAGALATTLQPEITRTWNRTAVAAQNITIKSGGGQGGGKSVNWDVEMDGASAAAFAEGSDIGGGELDYDPVVQATLPWGQYRAAFQISNLELNAARENIANATALEDLFAERVLGKAAKLLSQINKDIFTGTGTASNSNPNIVGLNSALLVNGGGGTYATLAVNTYSTWASTVVANGGTARSLTLALMASTEAGLYTASGFEPDFLLGSPNLHAKYEGLFEPLRRTVDSGQGPVPSYQGSTGRLFWRGKPIVRDKDNPTGFLYFLNKNEIELRVLPFGPAPDGVRTETRDAQAGNGQNMQAIGMPVHIYPLGRTGSGVKFVVEIYVQLQVRRPNAHAILSDLSET